MKKLIVGLILALTAAIAFAIPAPRDIEDALAAQRYGDAKSMITEVLRERPDSARAHLLKAFVLIHVDKNPVAANNELETASSLDKDGKVRNSALFGRTVAEIDLFKRQPPPAPKAKPTPPVAQPATQAVVANDPVVQHAPKKDEGSGFGTFLLVILLIGGVAVVAVLMIRRKNDKPIYVEPYRSTYTPAISRNPVVNPVIDTYEAPRRLPYSSSRDTRDNSWGAPVSPAPVVHQTVIQQPQNQGLGFGGQLAATAGGVVAGNVISDILLHPKHSSSHDTYNDRGHVEKQESYNTYSEPEPSPVSYKSERASFASSTEDDNSWTSTRSTSSFSSARDSDDDSWTSRSTSSPSYSSSSDSGSSWDSGSSSSSDSSW